MQDAEWNLLDNVISLNIDNSIHYISTTMQYYGIHSSTIKESLQSIVDGKQP